MKNTTTKTTVNMHSDRPSVASRGFLSSVRPHSTRPKPALLLTQFHHAPPHDAANPNNIHDCAYRARLLPQQPPIPVGSAPMNVGELAETALPPSALFRAVLFRPHFSSLRRPAEMTFWNAQNKRGITQLRPACSAIAWPGGHAQWARMRELA